MPTQKDDTSNFDVIRPKTATIPQFVRYSGMGRSKIYELINKQVIETVRFGSRQLIVLESYDQNIADQLAKKRAPG